MNEDLNRIFQDYLHAHLDEDEINFNPLLDKNPHHREALIRKIDSYRRAVDAIRSVPSDQPRPAIGHVIGGCRLEGIIGKGGMGVVYAATQLSLGRKVALKVFNVNTSSKSYSIDRFKREGLTISRLEHPSIIPVYDVGEQEGIHYIVMKYVDGIPLEEVLRLYGENNDCPSLQMVDKKRERISLISAKLAERYKNFFEFACLTIVRIGEGVSYAHIHNVIHRDIKPSNILIRADGEVVLVDFGISKDFGDSKLTQTGEYLGTPLYSSPEQLFGEKIDGRSDVYSLGMTLFELVAGHLPFADSSLGPILDHLKKKIPFDPRAANPAIPADLATIILTATHPDPQKRYANIDDFIKDLRAFLNFSPIVAKAPGRMSRVIFYLKMHQRRVMTMTLLALTMLAVPVFFVVRGKIIRNRIDALYLQSNEWLATGNFQQRILTLEKIIKLDPAETKAMAGIAESQSVLGIPLENIKKYLDEKLSAYPTDVYLLNTKAHLLVDMDRPAEAVALYEVLIKREEIPDREKLIVCRQLGAYYSKRKMFPDLSRVIDPCLLWFPRDAPLNFLRFMECREKEDVKCQVKHLKLAAEEGNDWRHYLLLGFLMLQQSQYLESKSYFEKTLKHVSGEDQKYAYFGLAKVCDKLNDYPCVIENSKKASVLNQTNLDMEKWLM